MRIDHDTAAYTGSQLTHSHTHHITKCLHEEEITKNKGAAAGIRRDAYEAAQTAVSEEEQDPIIGLGGRMEKPQRKTAGFGRGFIRGLWEAMGDEDTNGRESALPLHDKGQSFRGVRAMLVTVRQDISYYIVNKWEAVREKIKVGTHSALKHFGRNKNGFAMSSDIGKQSAGDGGRGKWEKNGRQKGTRQDREEIPSAYQADNHLMDSYSKNGEYCQINENLTYQKK